MGEQLWADYQEFTTRDLSEYDIVYLFVDGIAEHIRPGQKREPVLAAWGFTTEAKTCSPVAGRSRSIPCLRQTSTPAASDGRLQGDAETVSAFFPSLPPPPPSDRNDLLFRVPRSFPQGPNSSSTCIN